MMSKEESMKINDLAKMPKDFPERIHFALRSWHNQKPEGALDNLLLARQIATEREMVSLRLISNQILFNGIERLKQHNEEATDILQSRFLNRETAEEVAFRRNISADMIFQRQRAAIEQLAEVVWSQERELRGERIQRITKRLELPTYTQLFGVVEKLSKIGALLESDAEPWLISIEGLGGLGKTSMADALARQIAGSIHFDEIGWVSARRRMFQLTGEIETLNDRPDLTLAELADSLIEQFNLTGLAHCSDAEKLLGMKDFLKSRPCLVVVDNLETVANSVSLVMQLTGLANPSKFLMTTRYSLRDVSGVYIVTLQQLPRKDALLMIRYEAKTRGLNELSDAGEDELEPIYAVTDGNPLAIKLIVGQIHSLSLSVVLSRFRAVKGKPVETLLDFLHQAAWQALDADHRRVLQAMLLVAEPGGALEQIAAAVELSEDKAAACLQRLAVLSLIQISGSMHERRYSLHQLTQAFVAGQS
jgi:hypothetical protein